MWGGAVAAFLVAWLDLFIRLQRCIPSLYPRHQSLALFQDNVFFFGPECINLFLTIPNDEQVKYINPVIVLLERPYEQA